MPAVEINISLIIRYFEEQPVLRAWIFGSYADGNANEDSDVDILVELDPSVPVGLYFIQMIFDLEEITGKKIDLVTYSSLSLFLKPFVESQKRLIYEKK